MYTATASKGIDPPWTLMEPVRVGCVSAGLGTPDYFVKVEEEGRPLMRIDVYADPDHCRAFEQVLVWSGAAVMGIGHSLHFVTLSSCASSTLDLGGYFHRMYPTQEYLLVASAERLFRMEPDGCLRWSTQRLGIDGVIICQVDNGVIQGEGNWDPPHGEKRFRVNLDTGELLKES